jgi:hypothetical protein
MIENFVSNTENDQIVEKIFTLLGYSMLSLVVCGTLLWAYYISDKNQHFFISIFSLFMLFYALIIIAMVVINKNRYDALSYMLLFGITIFVIFITFFISVFFLLKYFNIFSSFSSSYQNVKYNINNGDGNNNDYYRRAS